MLLLSAERLGRRYSVACRSRTAPAWLDGVSGRQHSRRLPSSPRCYIREERDPCHSWCVIRAYTLAISTPLQPQLLCVLAHLNRVYSVPLRQWYTVDVTCALSFNPCPTDIYHLWSQTAPSMAPDFGTRGASRRGEVLSALDRARVCACACMRPHAE